MEKRKKFQTPRDYAHPDKRISLPVLEGGDMDDGLVNISQTPQQARHEDRETYSRNALPDVHVHDARTISRKKKQIISTYIINGPKSTKNSSMYTTKPLSEV